MPHKLLSLGAAAKRHARTLKNAIEFRSAMRIAAVDENKTGCYLAIDTGKSDADQSVACMVVGDKLYPAWVVEKLRDRNAELEKQILDLHAKYPPVPA